MAEDIDRLMKHAHRIEREGKKEIAEVIYAAASEIARMRGEMSWHPIATAPKNGTDILVYCGPLDPIWGVATWYRDSEDVPAGLPEGWMMWHQATEQQRHTWPTHWMQLPPAPSGQGGTDLSRACGPEDK